MSLYFYLVILSNRCCQGVGSLHQLLWLPLERVGCSARGVFHRLFPSKCTCSHPLFNSGKRRGKLQAPGTAQVEVGGDGAGRRSRDAALASSLSSASTSGPVGNPGQGQGLRRGVCHQEVPSSGSLSLLAEDGPQAYVCPRNAVVSRVQGARGARPFSETSPDACLPP